MPAILFSSLQPAGQGLGQEQEQGLGQEQEQGLGQEQELALRSLQQPIHSTTLLS
jgi:hypothetical protein